MNVHIPMCAGQCEVAVSLYQCFSEHKFNDVGCFVLVGSPVQGTARVEHLVQIANFLRVQKSGKQHLESLTEHTSLVI